MVTFPGLTWPDRLRETLRWKKLSFDEVHGPNMTEYCPEDAHNVSQSIDAARKMLQAEWHVGHRNASECQLQLFQMVRLIGHARAWTHVVQSGEPAVILEDEADVDSVEQLQSAVAEAQVKGANVALLDGSHCAPEERGQVSVRPWAQASGLGGYWVDAHAAQVFLNFPLDVPVDWGVNLPMRNGQLSAYCPMQWPVSESLGGGLSPRQTCEDNSAVQRVAAHRAKVPLLQAKGTSLSGRGLILKAMGVDRDTSVAR